MRQRGPGYAKSLLSLFTVEKVATILVLVAGRVACAAHASVDPASECCGPLLCDQLVAFPAVLLHTGNSAAGSYVPAGLAMAGRATVCTSSGV